LTRPTEPRVYDEADWGEGKEETVRCRPCGIGKLRRAEVQDQLVSQEAVSKWQYLALWLLQRHKNYQYPSGLMCRKHVPGIA